MYVGSFQCLDIQFDIFNSEIVLVRDNKCDYFITPNRIVEVEAWLIENNKDKVKTKEDLDFLINKGWLKAYD